MASPWTQGLREGVLSRNRYDAVKKDDEHEFGQLEHDEGLGVGKGKRKGEEELGPFRGLNGPKRLWIAYVFWLLGGWAGLHRLYLGDHAGIQMCRGYTNLFLPA